jgi:hypothetical protein
MWKTLGHIAMFSIVLFLFVYIYSILGMEIFAEKAKFNSKNEVDLGSGTSMDTNFDSFLWSFSTVFILITEDGWSNIFLNYYRAINGVTSTLYFISLSILGPRILLNLFLGILLDDFDKDSDRH